MITTRSVVTGTEGTAAQSWLAWAGPLGMVLARSILALLAQGLVTLIFLWQRDPAAAQSATAWWQVTGTLVDVGCLALLVWLMRREGLRLRDLVGLDRKKLLRDVLLGLGLLVVAFPVAMIGGSVLSGLLVFGTAQPALPPEMMTKSLPLWAALYARLAWWVIWSVTEEMTYNGYALPRLAALTGRTWLAVLIVGFGWALQHAFLPLRFDLQLSLFVFVEFLPLVVVMQLAYLRVRRLAPLIVMHWGMDLISAIVMISVA
jgi:hypothetical protein